MYLIKFKSGQTYLSKAFSDLQEDDCIPVHLRCISVYDFAALKSINSDFFVLYFYHGKYIVKKKKKKSLNFTTENITFYAQGFLFYFIFFIKSPQF